MISDHICCEWSLEVDNPMRPRETRSRSREDDAENDSYIDNMDIIFDLPQRSSSLRNITSRNHMAGRVCDEFIDLSFEDCELYHTSTFAAMSQDRLVKCKLRQYDWHRSHLNGRRDPAGTNLHHVNIGRNLNT